MHLPKLASVGNGPILNVMARRGKLQHLMTTGQMVLLDDGRQGRILRIDTSFPARTTTISLWMSNGPALAKVSGDAIVGPAPESASA